jgi:hypothetical protein
MLLLLLVGSVLFTGCEQLLPFLENTPLPFLL